ncbi:MAG: hypothetical protein JNM65_08595 [Verrucomicrobiaceae bacterium]|nr:hypothetical protein [Verrucomicrobiaceae bacterium]
MKREQKSARQDRSGRAYKTGGRANFFVTLRPTQRLLQFAAKTLVAVGTPILAPIRRFASPVIAANNNAADAANDAIAGTFTVIEGGKMVVPFGEREIVAVVNGRSMRVLQRIDAQAGNSMLDDLGGWLKRKLVGRPIFNGHPYHPDKSEAAKWPDKRSRGTIREITVGNEGITLEPSYNQLGKGEVEDGQFLFHSPQWRMEPVMGANGAQEVKHGMPVFRPVSLHSAGLTNNPNLDVPALVAANEGEEAAWSLPGGEIAFDVFDCLPVTSQLRLVVVLPCGGA